MNPSLQQLLHSKQLEIDVWKTLVEDYPSNIEYKRALQAAERELEDILKRTENE